MAEPVTVVAEATPNPNSFKFTVNRQITSGAGQSFGNPGEALLSPLAQRLFAIDGVRSVFLLKDFVSVGRVPGADWDALIPLIAGAIRAYFESRQ
jgi:hypothetical protein